MYRWQNLLFNNCANQTMPTLFIKAGVRRPFYRRATWRKGQFYLPLPGLHRREQSNWLQQGHVAVCLTEPAQLYSDISSPFNIWAPSLYYSLLQLVCWNSEFSGNSILQRFHRGLQQQNKSSQACLFRLPWFYAFSLSYFAMLSFCCLRKGVHSPVSCRVLPHSAWLFYFSPNIWQRAYSITHKGRCGRL